MLTEIRATNPNRASLGELRLPLMQKSAYPIRYVDGLTPPKAAVMATPYAGVDEEYYQGSRVGARNIVLTLGLEPDYSVDEDVETLRRRVYSFFTPGTPVRLYMTTDKGRNVNITGIVESFEGPLFVEDPVVQVSVVCHKPYFETNTSKIYATSRPNTIQGFITIQNDGDVPAPVVITATAGGSGTSLDVSVVSHSTKQFVVMGGTTAGDIFVINSNVREKTVTRNAASVLHYLTNESVWPVIPVGTSQLHIRTPGASSANIGYDVRFSERLIGL